MFFFSDSDSDSDEAGRRCVERRKKVCRTPYKSVSNAGQTVSNAGKKCVERRKKVKMLMYYDAYVLRLAISLVFICPRDICLRQLFVVI